MQQFLFTVKQVVVKLSQWMDINISSLELEQILQIKQMET